MGEELNDQGLQNGGNSPEPTQQQQTEGNLNPDPSQDNTDQLTGQNLQGQIPDQDDRGVPAQNVLSEVLRKMNDMADEIKSLKTNQTSYQPPRQFQEYHEPKQFQQTQQVIPRSPEEAAKIIDREVREKFGPKMNEPGFDALEMLAYQNQRMIELNGLMNQSQTTIHTERNNSENRIKGFYSDLNNPQSQLSQGVLNEIHRRAYLNNMTAEQYYQRNPYLVESIAPMVAGQLGITPKIQSQVRIAPKPNNNLPPSNLAGRQPVQNKAPEKPTQDDILFGQRFGIKPDSLVKSRGAGDPTEFIDESNVLLS